jgi:MFS transporter, DHA2 family, methylenomycin A resistance protein
VLAALALGATTYALIEGPERGLSQLIVLTASVRLIASAAFVLAERRSPNPVLAGLLTAGFRALRP